jgi:hypothetical protein
MDKAISKLFVLLEPDPEPRTEEPKLDSLAEPEEPKIGIAAPAPFYLPQT